MRQLAFDAPAVERGVGFFETILLVGDRAVCFGEHVARLRGTLTRFDLPAPDEERIYSEARGAVTGNVVPGPEAALRLTWIALGKELDSADAWRLDASTRPIPKATLQRRAGSRSVTLPRSLARDTPEAKSTSYLGAVLGSRWAQRAGADEGLFVGQDGSYFEGTATAILAWDRGDLAYPAFGVLPSVTAAAFMRARGKSATPRRLERSDLLAGAVLLGSLSLACPLLSLDEVPCAQPPEMLESIRIFNERLVDESSPSSQLHSQKRHVGIRAVQ